MKENLDYNFLNDTFFDSVLFFSIQRVVKDVKNYSLYRVSQFFFYDYNDAGVNWVLKAFIDTYII